MGDRTINSWSRSLDKETNTSVEGTVQGQIPDWINGVLVRNGGGVNQVQGVKFNHLFDGFSVLHRFAIQDGKVTYRNRVLQSETYLKSIANQRLIMDQFGTLAFPDPCQSIFGRFMAKFAIPNIAEMTDNCAVSVAYFGDGIYAMTETNQLHRIDPKTLETRTEKKIVMTDYVAVNTATAHPHVEKDGTVYNLGTSYLGARGPCYHIVRFPAEDHQSDDVAPFKQATIVASIPCRWKFHPAYFHSFGVTENYFVFLETPLAVNLLKLATMKLMGTTFKDSMEWYGHEKTRIVLINRSTGNSVPVTYEAPPLFAFHFINCYEKEGQLVMDICAAENGLKFIETFSKEPPVDSSSGYHYTYPTRIVLPLSTKVDAFFEPQRLSEIPMELPRINYAFNGMEYRYCYGVGLGADLELYRLIKLDLQTQETLVWEKPGFTVSEPVFVANPKSVLEDDGVVLSTVLNEKDHCKVYLLVLRGMDFKELAMVEFHAKGVVPLTFHGMFASKSEKVHLF